MRARRGGRRALIGRSARRDHRARLGAARHRNRDVLLQLLEQARKHEPRGEGEPGPSASFFPNSSFPSKVSSRTTRDEVYRGRLGV